MSRRLLSALVLACMAMAAGTLAYTASATVPTNKLYTMMTGAQEVPGPGDANARGIALLNVRPASGEVCVNVRFSRIDGTLSGMHIHEGKRGVAGPIVINLTAALSNNGVGCGAASAATISALRMNPRRFYLNVHSEPAFGGGAIRGQLFDSDL